MTTWRDVFAPYAKQIAEIERSLKEQREYLRPRFEQLSARLEEMRKKGTDIVACHACGFDAAMLSELADGLSETKCLVCNTRRRWLLIECAKCGTTGEFEGDVEPFVCAQCGTSEDTDALVERLDERARYAPDEATLAITPANCSDCEGYHTVIERGGQYLCLVCLEPTESLNQCEWCSEYSTGDMSESYLLGCGICEGHSGWHRDD